MMHLTIGKRKKIRHVMSIDELESIIKESTKNFKQFTPRSLKSAEELMAASQVTVKQFKCWLHSLFGGHVSKATLAFWEERGYSIDEAHAKVSEWQSKNSKKRHSKPIDVTEYNTRIEYYIARGYTMLEAREALRKRQITFSLDKCIKRWGADLGYQKWYERQQRWQTTMRNKTPEEKLEIAKKKIVPLGRASKQSLAIFEPLARKLIDSGVVSDSDIYYGYHDKKEWFLGDESRFYLFDFCIPKLKLIIEYQGSVWHPDYRLSSDELESWRSCRGVTASEIKQHDDEKRAFAEINGYNVTYLWGLNTPEQNMNVALNACTQALEKSPISVTMGSVKTLMSMSKTFLNSPDGFQRVSEFFVKEKELFSLTFDDGRLLECSADHFLQTIDGDWIAAKDVTTEHSLLTSSGAVKLVNKLYMGLGITNDVTIEHPNHRYYANGISSHNTGKTLLAIAAGITQVLEDKKFDKLIVTRPIQPLGRDIGYLPGTKEEKMSPWVQPIVDNLEYLFGSSRTKSALQMYFENHTIEVEAITYIRGRSVPNAYIIIDESQNLTVHELKTIITRAGEGTKIVLTGDIDQIDNAQIDAVSNGLTYAVEKFKNYDLAGHITLIKGERSRLATLAAEIL